MKKYSYLVFFYCLISWVHISAQSFGEINLIEYKDLLYVDVETAENDSLQRLDLIIPQAEGNYPLLIWIGGGAWSYGDRTQEIKVARRFSEAGMAVASIGHRMSPATWRDPSLDTGIRHPKHTQDVAQAVKWVMDHAEEYRINTKYIFIGGYSSGAHIAALLSLDNSYLEEVGLSPDIFSGVIPISGTYDIMDYHKTLAEGGRPELAELHVEAVFGDLEADFLNASPTSYLENLSIPMLVISDNDLYAYTRLFEDRIRETEFRNMQVVYSYDLSHGGLWRNLSAIEQSMYRDIIVDFIHDKSVFD